VTELAPSGALLFLFLYITRTIGREVIEYAFWSTIRNSWIIEYCVIFMVSCINKWFRKYNFLRNYHLSELGSKYNMLQGSDSFIILLLLRVG